MNKSDQNAEATTTLLITCLRAPNGLHWMNSFTRTNRIVTNLYSSFHKTAVFQSILT